MAGAYDIYELGNFELQSGMTIESAKLTYTTFGQLNSQKSNAIVFPTWYSGFIENNFWLVGEVPDPGMPSLGSCESGSPDRCPVIPFEEFSCQK